MELIGHAITDKNLIPVSLDELAHILVRWSSEFVSRVGIREVRLFHVVDKHEIIEILPNLDLAEMIVEDEKIVSEKFLQDLVKCFEAPGVS